MSSGNQTWEENLFDLVVKFVLPVAAVIGAIYFLIKLIGIVLFWVWWSVPFAIFYVAPVLVLSPLLGFLWAVLCQVSPPDAEDDSRQEQDPYNGRPRKNSWQREYSFPLQLNYAWVVVYLPITVFFAYGLVGVPVDHQVVHETVGTGKHAQDVARIVLQWPWVYQHFNDFNAWWQSVFSFLLEGKSYREMLFDRNDVAGSVWVAVLIGAPVIFWFESARKLTAQEITRETQAWSVVEKERARWENKEATWRSNEAKLEQSIQSWSAAFEKQKAQLETYKAREEHLVRPALRVELEKTKPGVLDSDML
jgi:hypothetical protein